MTTTHPPTAAAARGRVVGPVRAAWLVVEGLWTWYRRNWRATVFSSVLQPVLFLLALGVGFGSQVRPGAVPGGVTYLEYLTPALLAVGAVQVAAFETSYPVLSGFKWQKTYWGVTASPVSAGQLVGGQLVWITIRLFFSGAVFLAVAALFGGVRSVEALAALPFAALAGMAFGAPLAAYSATILTEGQQFNAVFRFVLMPMTLFSGTFFPLDFLPAYLRPVAWLTPLWHGTELARGSALGTLRWWPALGHVAYLCLLVAVGLWFARRNFSRRLTP